MKNASSISVGSSRKPPDRAIIAPCSESLNELPVSLCAQAFAIDSGGFSEGLVPKYSPALTITCASGKFFDGTSPWTLLFVASDNRELLRSNGSITESRLLLAVGNPKVFSVSESNNPEVVRSIGSLICVASLPPLCLAEGVF